MKTHLVIAALLLTACYEYSTFTPSQDTLGKAVRVQLTDAGAVHVTGFVGPGADYIDGNLAAMTDSTYTLAITDLGRKNSSEESWKGEPLTLNRNDASSITLRKGSAAKSAGLTALLAGGAIMIARAIKGNEGTIITKPGGTGGGK